MYNELVQHVKLTRRSRGDDWADGRYSRRGVILQKKLQTIIIAVWWHTQDFGNKVATMGIRRGGGGGATGICKCQG